MSSPTITLPERFGRYEVQALIGEGSMGRVYRAFDPLAHRVVAIKTLKSEYLASDTREEYLRRFRREAQAAGALSHPHIITVFDVGEDFFVMELLEGATLQAILHERGTLGPADALALLGPMAEALDYAHTKGTIHRDIKPGNIMVLPDGRPKIMDFGVAHLTSTVMTAAGQFLGSPSYMAPEQIMKSEASPRSDLFSFAVLSYEALTGHKPFEGESVTTIIYKVVNEQPPPPRRWNESLPPRYDEVFRRALDKEPERRFETTRAFVAALEAKEIDAVLGLEAVLSAPIPPPALLGGVETYDLRAEEVVRAIPAEPSRPPAPAARPRRGWVTAALGALTLAALGFALLRGSEPRPAPTPTPPAGLRVVTEPSAAAVFLDGSEAGKSPLILASVVPGPHTVRAVLEGFAPAELSFELVAGVSMAPLRFVLQPISVTLRLRSEPADATLSVDGHAPVATPVDGLSLQPGLHELRVERRGFRPWQRRVEARIGEGLDLEARLEPAEGRAAARAAAPPPPTPRPEVHEGDLVLDPNVTPPKKISGEWASYPEAAEKLKLKGLVAVDMIIDEKGEPTDLRVIESAGEILDQAVVDALRRWRFEPARKDGVKVRVHYEFRQRFQRER